MLNTIFTTKQVESQAMISPSGVSQGMYYKVAIEPLEQGYGQTLGNALRRVLLTSIPGAAITKVRIAGVDHQFTTLEGMREDIVELVLNLKQVRLSIKDGKETVLKLSAKGPGKVTAGDITVPATVTIANPDLEIANLSTAKNKLEAEITVKPGVGYVMAESSEDMAFGDIPVDSLFSPITKVAYKIEATRVGRRTDFDKLVMEIWTDGTIDALEAIHAAAKVLVAQFKQIFEPAEVVEDEPVKTPELEGDSMNLTVEELGIPTRIANALRKGGYKTVRDLVEAESATVAKVKNLGDKSVDVVAAALAKYGVSLKD